ncbi:FxsA family protein [Salinicola peritrichatus]|uniref:FxsA family protein n=1 Tax=Salinicola peritrichatus TaxID=1267424 RepID=UPI000DA234A3|nr:FxsA family protein [Salinicola peritrichatus]
MPLLFLLALFTIADFAMLFAIGAKIGLLATLVWMVVSAAFGLHLIRRESFLTLQRARERLALGEIPSDELMAGASFVLAGVLLMAPGFLSDIVGLLCLLPGSGQLMRRWFGNGSKSRVYDARVAGEGAGWQSNQRTAERASTGHQRGRGGDSPIEGDYLGKDDSYRH